MLHMHTAVVFVKVPSWPHNYVVAVAYAAAAVLGGWPTAATSAAPYNTTPDAS